MAVERRYGGLPLAIYVVALVVIPLAAVAVFGLREIDRNNEAADTSVAVADAVELYAAASAVTAPLQVEELAATGLAVIHELGLPPELVLEFAGIDFDGLRTENAEDLDVSLSRLETVLETNGVSSPSLAAVVTEARDRLDQELIRLGEDTSSVASVTEAFTVLNAQVQSVLNQATASLRSVRDITLNELELVREIEMMSEVLDSARSEVAMVVDAVVGGGSVTEEQLMTSNVLHDNALERALWVDADLIRQLQESYESLNAVPEELFDVPDSELSSNPTVVADLADLLLERIGYLRGVADVSTSVSTDVSTELGAIVESSTSRNETTLFVFVAVGVVSLLFGYAVMRSFTRPLTRLRTQAERISRGELHADPLPVDGPSDVRKVTSAVNEMARTLTLVDEHMRALAKAENGEGPILRELPGEVGASMRTSMERVTALTSRLQMSEARLAEEARIDNLTGLPNRFAVLEYLERTLRRIDSLQRNGVEGVPAIGVMFVDVDGFKSVNDTHGHAVGDVVLREVAQRLKGAVRDLDFVARLGGDEFLIVVAEANAPDRLAAFGGRIIQEIEQPYTIGDQLFGVSASVGVTLIEAGDDSLSAIERADAAVYQAKRRGRRRVELFDKELQRSIEHQAEIELALRQAIRHDELRVHLQPLADLRTGRVAGAEALVRWERPGVGLVPPSDFIPIAERSGLIFELERWVLEASCRRIAEWRLMGKAEGMRLAVNISGRHLVEGDLLNDLDDVIAATGADPNLLEIELTESQLLDDVGRAIEILAGIRSRGIKVAIDDFGTGYSSMTYLQKLPVDIVKIDRSFISSATANEFDSTIVESVVTIGRTLDLDIVAEGIETMDQLSYVMQAGVTLGQGYLLSRPLPAADAEAILFGPPLFEVDRVHPERRLAAASEVIAPIDVPTSSWYDRPPAGTPIPLTAPDQQLARPGHRE